MGFKNNIGKRDDFITATFTRNYANPVDAYDDDGKLKAVGQPQTTTIEFWGKVYDLRSNTQEGGGKRRDTKQKRIECDSRDIEELTIDFTLSIAGRDERFQVVDIYDKEFRFTSEIIAEYIK